MLTARSPWPDFPSPWAAMFHIANAKGPPPGVPPGLPIQARTFLDECFKRAPAERPSAAELLEHPFISAPHLFEDWTSPLPPSATASGSSVAPMVGLQPALAGAAVPQPAGTSGSLYGSLPPATPTRRPQSAVAAARVAVEGTGTVAAPAFPGADAAPPPAVTSAAGAHGGTTVAGVAGVAGDAARAAPPLAPPVGSVRITSSGGRAAAPTGARGGARGRATATAAVAGGGAGAVGGLGGVGGRAPAAPVVTTHARGSGAAAVAARRGAR